MKKVQTKFSNIVLLPYNVGSGSAKRLAEELTNRVGLRVRNLYNDERSKFVPRDGHRIICWGSSRAPFSGGRFFNGPDRIAAASNKLVTFQTLRNFPNVRIPAFTENKEEAAKWIEEGAIAVARTQLSAHSGAGIVVCSRVEDLPDCRLYTKYIKKKKEFRVHVVGGNVIDVQQKKRRTDYEGDTNFAIRNHQNGWIYAREEIVEPTELRQQAVEAVIAMGLDFGAVDIIYNEHQNQCTVLEINTAPGLEGTSVTNYANALLEMINNDQASR